MQEQINFNRGAVKPIQCLSDGWEMLRGQYGALLGVLIIGFFIILLGACIPLSPLMPPMLCGIYLCLFAIMNGQPFNSSTLFKGFDFFAPSFVASLVTTIPIFVLSMVMQLGIGGMSALVDTLKVEKNPRPEEILPVVLAFFGFIFGIYLLILIVSVILGTLMAFVYPLIVDRRLGALDAIKLSFRAVMGNFFGVLGLMLLGQLLVIAGVMLFYVGAIFVAPIIFAAWAVAYRRVFPPQILQPASQMGAPPPPPQQPYARTPPVSSSKAGWVLTLGALAILGTVGAGIASFGFFAYQGITKAIEQAEERRKNEFPVNTPWYPPPTPDQATTPNRLPTPRDLSKIKAISGGVLNGKAVELPQPTYPPAAKAVRAGGAVTVQVEVDEVGKVTSARAVSGHPLLRASAEAAARQAKFSPTLLSGKPVKVSGVLVYNFVPE